MDEMNEFTLLDNAVRGFEDAAEGGQVSEATLKGTLRRSAPRTSSASGPKTSKPATPANTSPRGNSPMLGAGVFARGLVSC